MAYKISENKIQNNKKSLNAQNGRNDKVQVTELVIQNFENQSALNFNPSYSLLNGPVEDEN